MNTVKVELGQERGPDDGWKRYTPLAHSFDTRATALSFEVQDDWEPQIQEQWRTTHREIREALIHEYGAANYEQKVENFKDLGSAPWSVIGLHDTHLKQVRGAFVSMDYYPALVGASSLGERILNHLVLSLRGDYPDHEATKHVAKKHSVDDWGKCIKALNGWGVFDDSVAKDYLGLMKKRHAAVHYRSQLDADDARESALEAVKLLCGLIERIFNSIGEGKHYFIGPIGRGYIRLESEQDPFVRKFLLPACALVSPNFRFIASSTVAGGFDAWDDPEQGKAEPPLTDLEFADPARHTPQVPYPF